MNWLYFPRDKIFAKIRQFRWWCDLQRWLDPIIASWNVCKSKAVFLKWFEKVNCLYYHELKFRKNTLDLMKSLENLNCRFYQEVTFLQKVKHFCWCNLKIRPAPIITSKNFGKNQAVFLKRLELHQLSRAGIFSKMRQFWWYLLKFDLLILSQAKIFAKIC